MVVVRHEDLGSNRHQVGSELVKGFTSRWNSSGSTLPPLTTTTVEPVGRTRPASSAAVVTAPEGSVTSCSSSVEVTDRGGNLVLRNLDRLANHAGQHGERQLPDGQRQQAVGQTLRSARAWSAGRLRAPRPAWPRPSARPRQPRTDGFSAATAAAIPAIRPPPPTGTRMVSTAGRLVQDLEAAGSLAGNDIQALVRGHHRKTSLLRQRNRAAHTGRLSCCPANTTSPP